ncbi:MAG: hypothetical protein DLM66_08650 [Candidatus Dormiibacter spiritus]|nr:MAG: hypothetical protein DLM66_08650 [Candidatus Dormibacteraeota bacterium]
MEESMTEELTPQQVFDKLPEYFRAEKAGNANANVQFNLTGDQGGQWWVKIADQTATSHEGTVENPNLTLTADGHDYVKIATGTMDATSAFMSGKLKVKGDMGLAMKMASLFKRP